MIKKIIKFQTEDGIEFDTEYEATQHSKFLDTITELTAILGEMPNKWLEHVPYYIQRHSDNVDVVRSRLFKMLKVKSTTEFGYLFMVYSEPRYLSLRNLLCRLSLIDREGREFSSLYFKHNPKGCRGEYRK